MLTKNQTFELYTKIMKMRDANMKAVNDFRDKEAQEKAANTLAEVLITLRKNCKEHFWEWPDQEIK